MIRSRSGGRTTLGAFAFRAFARALAWLAFFGRAGPSVGRGIGLVAGAERCGRCSRVGLRLRGGASAGRAGGVAARRGGGSSPPRTGAGLLCLHGYPPTFSSARSRTDALRGLTFDLRGACTFGSAGQSDEFRLVAGQFDG